MAKENCNEDRMLTYDELNNKYIKLKYELRVHRWKTRILYQKFCDIYKKYWEIYDFLSTGHSKDVSLINKADEDFVEWGNSDSSLPF